VDLLWKEKGSLVTHDMEKFEVPSDFFKPQSSMAGAPATSPKLQKGKGRDWENEEPPTVGKDQV